VGHHRTLADDLRRVLGRLGGAPAVNVVAPAGAPTHTVGLCAAAVAAPPLGLGVPAATVPPPGADLAATRPPAPSAAPRTLPVALAAGSGAVAVAPPPPRVRAGGIGAVVRCGAVPPAPARAVVAGVRPVRAPAVAGATVPVVRHLRVRAERPLPRAARAGGTAPPPAGPLLVARRRRAGWTGIDRGRLARAWGRMLADHGLPGDELTLIGLYGPVPLGLVAGVALEPDGRVALRLARARSTGPPGDVVLARHAPTGRLLRVDVAAAGPPGAPGTGRRRRAPH
jgi:hypothetical protein